MNLVERKKKTSALIERQKEQMLALVSNDKSKFEQYKAVMIEMSQNKSLANCSTESVVKTATRIIQLGLNPNPLLNEAYVIARGIYQKQQGKQYPVKIGEEAELQIGVKGYKILGFRSGWTFSTEAVYECDDFSMQLGEMEPIISLVPDFKKRSEDNGQWVYKNLIGVIVFAKDPSGNISKKYVRREKLEKIRMNSPTQKKHPHTLSGIWLDWAEEMFAKSALKYTIKRQPIDSTVMAAIIADEEGERGELETIDVEVSPNQSKNLKKGSEIAQALKGLGLSLYLFEDKAVVEGNTFNSASVLKELGFQCDNNEWYFLFENMSDLYEACLPGIEVMQKGEYLGVHDDKVGKYQEKLIEYGFKHTVKKSMWLKKITEDK